MLEWKDEYSVGVRMIDEQHKRLFDLGDRAYKMLKDEFCVDKYDRIIEVLEELREYTIFHFGCEEKYMLSMNYKDYPDQKREHDGFIEKINEIDFNHIDENQEEYTDELLCFIFDWILKHILKKDTLMAKETLSQRV